MHGGISRVWGPLEPCAHALAWGHPQLAGTLRLLVSFGGRALTFLQHPHFEAFHEAAGLAGLPPPLGDLTLVGGRAAVLDVPCKQTQTGLPGAMQGPIPRPETGWGLTGRPTLPSTPRFPRGSGSQSRCSEVLAKMFPTP